MIVFLDTEFTDLVHPQLLSIGLVGPIPEGLVAIVTGVGGHGGTPSSARIAVVADATNGGLRG